MYVVTLGKDWVCMINKEIVWHFRMPFYLDEKNDTTLISDHECLKLDDEK